MQTETKTIRVYIADLAAYNNGFLHGVWCDATDDLDDIHEQIQAMLAASPVPNAEEYAIHDFEGFEGIPIEEYTSIEKVCEIAGLLEKYGPAYGCFADLQGLEYATDEAFEDAYHGGSWDSEEDFAYDWWEQSGLLASIPEELQGYIDFERVARDMFIDGFMSARDSSGTLHVFSR